MLGFGFGHRSVAVYMSMLTLSLLILALLMKPVSSNIILFVFPLITYLVIHPKVLGILAVIHHRIFGNHLDDEAPTRIP